MEDKVRVDGIDGIIQYLRWINMGTNAILWSFGFLSVIQLIILALILWRVW